MREKNRRYRIWRQLIARIGLIRRQEDMSKYILGRTGEPVSQSYISNIETGTSNLPDRQVLNILRHFPFTKQDYFFNGNEDIIELKDLLKFLLDKHQLKLIDLSIAIDIQTPVLSSLNNHSDLDRWKDVFEYFNENFGYTIDPHYIFEHQLNYGISSPEFTGKSEQVERLQELLDYMIEKGIIMSVSEFAKEINTNRNLIYNMKLPDIAQDVTKNMLVEIATRYPKINIEWILVGRGSMLKSEDSLTPHNPNIEILNKKLQLLERDVKSLKKAQSEI